MHSGNINDLSYYYFPEALKNSLFSEQNIVGQNCTENLHQIHQIHVKKLLLEKIKNKILISSSILARKPIFLSRVALGPLSAHRLGSAENGPLLEGMPRQGRNLGLGQEFAPRTRSPRLGLS
jgi:hypothetical protein